MNSLRELEDYEEEEENDDDDDTAEEDASLFAGLPSPSPSSPALSTTNSTSAIALSLSSSASRSSPAVFPTAAEDAAAPPPPSFSPRGKHKLWWWFFFLFSLFLLLLLPIVVRYLIAQGVIDQIVVDGPNASGYAMFRNRSSQGGTLMEYTFFNITNPHQVLLGLERPHLEELGPFIYQQTQLRDDVQFDPESDLVSFRQQIYQTFDAEATFKATGGRFATDQVRFCTINILFYGMASVVGDEYWHLINDHLPLWQTDFERLFVHNTVRETIEGYQVTLPIGPLIKIPIAFPGLVPSYRDEDKWNSLEYRYVNKIFMGGKKQNLERVNSLYEWGPGKRHARVPCPWGNNPLSGDCRRLGRNNPCCGVGLQVKPWGQDLWPELWNADANEVQGTLGDAFRPYLKRHRGDDEEERVVVWSDQLFRALQFSNRDRRAVSLHNIHLLRFTATREFWSNSTEHPANARFYQYGPHGLVNASIIYLGAPIFVSLPHFLDSAPELLEGVTGLQPDEEKHSMFIDVEPTTGMTFREHNRIQINVHIKGKLGPKWFPNLKDCYVPVGYFDAHSEINQVGVDAFLALYNGLSILYGAMAFGAVGLAVTVCGSPVYAWFQSHHRKRKSQRAILRQRSLRSVLVLEDGDGEDALT